MARLLQQLLDPPSACSYLPAETASLHNRLMVDVSPEELEALLARGWRRFGAVYFRPACEACRACVPLRVPVARFRPSRSQRRAARACAGLRAVVGPPQVDAERLALYRAWHRERESARRWAPAALSARAYHLELAFPHPAVREIAYYDDLAPSGPRLVGLGICDETPAAWSAVYFFYDPAYARRSIGVANILRQIEVARARALPHVYLGYRIIDCPSMAYKDRFRPHELLIGRPAAGETPRWIAAP
jgi:arginine-tRNA-protein transferase